MLLSDDKKYRDILDALEQAKISLMTIFKYYKKRNNKRQILY
ncbi:hypothetical protein [Spiroplasma citri]|nr:hypothetical protein [Spiroplasma citri]